jgi:hypothetical protein
MVGPNAQAGCCRDTRTSGSLAAKIMRPVFLHTLFSLSIIASSFTSDLLVPVASSFETGLPEVQWPSNSEIKNNITGSPNSKSRRAN